MLTYERLHELLDYDKDTGVFNWKIRRDRNGRLRGSGGKIAGYQQKNGYVKIRVDRKGYWAHRLAWLFVYGHFPENNLDHKNQIRNANWIKNLREVSCSCNMRNSKMSVANTSGVKGVHWYKRAKKWRARIMANGKNIYLGIFTDKLDAAKARHDVEVKYDWATCNTKASSAYNYIQKCG